MVTRRSITGFHQDDEGDWVAELSCHHNQHVRHKPPFQDRPWVVESASREARIGTPLECPLCDQGILPASLVLVRTLGPWDEDAIPAALLREHRTPSGQWGCLCVEEGPVGFQFHPSGEAPGPLRHLGSGTCQGIPPDVPHRVVVTGPVRLQLELWGPPAATATPPRSA